MACGGFLLFLIKSAAERKPPQKYFLFGKNMILTAAGAIAPAAVSFKNLIERLSGKIQKHLKVYKNRDII